MSFSTLFDTPFFTGFGGLSDQVPWPWPIAIDGHPFALDLAHYQWALPDMMRPSFDQSDRPGEGSYEVHGVWRRIYDDWSLGAGQVYADPPPSSASSKDATRQFANSLGIDPWTPRTIRLQPNTELYGSGTNLTPILLFTLGQWLYTLDGTNLFRTNNPQAAIPTQTLIGFITSPTDVTTDGNNVYVVNNQGIYTHDSSAGTIAISLMPGAAGTTAAAGNIIEWANGWLLVGKGATLSSVSSTGTMTSVTVPASLRPTGWTWTAIVGAPNAIYAGGNASDRSCIYSIGIDPNTGGLAAATYAGELPHGETLKSLAYYGQVVMVGTNKGWHVATIQSGNSLAIGPLIPTANPVECMAADGKYVWFGWTNYDSTHTGLGRANLGEFTDTLLPAYASDIMYVGQGRVTSVARYQGNTYFSVDQVGVFRQSSDGSLVLSGTIRLGRLMWGTQAAKTYLGAEIVTEPLNGAFTATLEDETGKQTAIGGRNITASTGRGTLIGSGLGTNSNYYDLILTLTRGQQTPTVGPVIRAITTRAMPVPRATRTWTLPIQCFDKVQPQDETSEFSQDVKEIQDFLLNLRISGSPVLFQEGQSQQLVIVRTVEFADGSVTQWSFDRKAVQGVLTVTVADAEA